METNLNTRILVIDDDETVRESFRKILQPSVSGKEEEDIKLEEAGAVLFNEAKSSPVKRSSSTFNFEYDEARNGKQGYKLVQKAIKEDKPYAAIFVDMRMPGWDGLETVEHIRNIDERCEVIFVTAYSDYSIEEIVTSVGTNVSYHCKPFSVEEIEQIATKAVYEWNKTRSLENLIKTISQLRAKQWQMEPLLKNILHQVSYLMGTHSAMIAIRKDDKYKLLLAIGNLCFDKIADSYLQNLPENFKNEIFQNKDYAYFRMEKYGIIAVFEKGGRPLKRERTYLVWLFLEQAVKAIQNVHLQEELLRKEKLSAVGEATSMIAYNLKRSLEIIDPAVQMIEDHLDDRTFVNDMLDLIKSAVTESLAYVGDVLDFASNKKSNLILTDANEFFEGIKNKLRVHFPDLKIAYNFKCSGKIHIFIDRNKIYRVISSLIRNSVESLSTQTIYPEIILSASCDEKNIFIRVADNGPGIPENMQDKIFMPFYSSGKNDGSGLGLAVAKQIIEAHGGCIALDTKMKKGTAFNINIPNSKRH
jgi:K+-sensing histidine kinase KdpD